MGLARARSCSVTVMRFFLVDVASEAWVFRLFSKKEDEDEEAISFTGLGLALRVRLACPCFERCTLPPLPVMLLLLLLDIARWG